jgi:hypothetical protein
MPGPNIVGRPVFLQARSALLQPSIAGEPEKMAL